MRAWIGLGSNIGDGREMLGEAVRLLGDAREVRIQHKSSLYRTAPVGGEEQPDFTNAVIEIGTSLEPPALLSFLLDIEHTMGRKRISRRWRPRIIDLDLLLYEDRKLEVPGLVVPHPRMHERAFVLAPLVEIAPGLEVPGKGCVADLVKFVSGQRIERLDVVFYAVFEIGSGITFECSLHDRRLDY